MSTQSYYLQRAAELEALAQASDPDARTSYLELAEAFRDIANFTGVSQMQSDEEAVRLAERMVEKWSVYASRSVWGGKRAALSSRPIKKPRRMAGT
jgi:hypothetical protein